MSADEVVLKGSDYGPEQSVKLNGPPGTGKTTQLLERVTRLLDDGYTPSDLVFVTYRKEMASEFLRRLHEREYISDEEYRKPWENDTRHFGTLHAVCNRITPDAEVVDDSHKRDFIREVYDGNYDTRGAQGAQDDPVGKLLFEAYDWCVQNKQHSFVNAPNYKEIADRTISPPSFEEFGQAWSRFKAEGNEEGKPLRDFTGMLRKVDESSLRPSGSILVVDEYHDMTPIMASICEGWAETFDTVIVGGDPLQAIYTYKGADPSYFQSLDYPEVMLDRTYRVPSTIWDYAKGVIDHNPPDIEPATSGGQVRAVKGDPYDVIESYGEESTMYLARTQSQLYDIATALKERGVIFRSQEGIGGWNTSQTLLDLYNALQKVRDVRPADHIDPSTGQTGMARFDQSDVDEAPRLPTNVTLEQGEAKRLVNYTPAGYFSDTKKSVRNYVKGTSEVNGEDLLSRVEPSFWQDMTRGAGSVGHLLSYDPKDTLEAALQRYDRPFPVIDSAPVPDVLTIHASKGKEADTVALYDGIPGAVQRSIAEGERKKRAESRVWYVGCTRAAETLLVFRDQWDYLKPFLPSTAGT